MSQIDTRFLNIIINSKKELGDFSSNIGENIFEPKYRRTARQIINYYKTYNCCPTIETLKDFAAKNNKEFENHLDAIWTEINTETIDAREYGFYLKKLSRRYNIQIVKQIAERAATITEDNVDLVNDSIIKISGEIKGLGLKKVYKEVILKSHSEEWKQNFFAKAKNKELAQGLMTNFSKIDYYTNGLRKSEFGLIAGDTGSGKSIFLLDLATNCFMGENPLPVTEDELALKVEKKEWNKAYNVLFISLEMPAEEVIDRILSKMCSVNNLDLTKGSIISEEASRIKRALYYWENSPYNIKVVDMPRGCSIDSIQMIFDETCLEFKPDIVIIDYLGLMMDNDVKSEADWEKLKNVSQSLAEFGRLNEVVVFSAVQVTSSKPGEGGIGLHRIGRSRMIAHNANIVFQIENREDEDIRPDARIHCIKFRRGPKFIMDNLRKEFQFTRFADMGFSPNKEKTTGAVATPNEDLSDMLNKIFGE